MSTPNPPSENTEASEELEDLSPQPSTEHQYEEPPLEKTAEPTGERPSRALAFARRHPVLSVAGAATIGLFGGLELAAGVLLGVGVATMVRGRRSPEQVAEDVNDRAGLVKERAEHVKERAEHAKERARTMMERVRPEVRKRARAVVQAARGKLDPATP